MADDTLIGDDVRGRTGAFLARLGVSDAFYTSAILRSVLRSQLDPADPAQTPWQPIGGRNIGGRIRALVQDPRNPLVIYAGSAHGGVFKTSDGGDTWAPIGQPEDAFPVGALAIDAIDPNILYVGTGEPTTFTIAFAAPGVIQAFGGAATGSGFYRCNQAVLPLAFVQEAGSHSVTVAAGSVPAFGEADRYSRIVADPNVSGRLWIASDSGLWRREPAGTFHREPVPNPAPVAAVLQGAPVGAAVTDIVLVENPNPAQPRTYLLYAAVAAVGIFRGLYTRAAAGDVVWEPAPLANGLPAVSTPALQTHDRIRIAACKSFLNHLYAVFENGLPAFGPDQRAVLNVFHSADGGNTWTPGPAPALPTSPRNLIGDLPVLPPVVPVAQPNGGQPWSHMEIGVHPDNPAIVVAGGLNLIISRDFGATWVRILEWQNFGAGDRSQHGDQHAIMFDGADPRRLWVGNDGGIAMAPDIVQANPLSAATWRKRSHGIQAAQFNDIAVHPNPAYPFIIGGGLQDNASFASFGGETWFPIGDADGGQVAFDFNDPRTFIAPNQSLVIRSTVVAPTTLSPVLGRYPLVQRRPVNADLDTPNDHFAVQLNLPAVGPLNTSAPLFIPIVEQHRTTPRHLLVGRGSAASPAAALPARLFVSRDFGTGFADVSLPAATFLPAPVTSRDVSAIAYGNAAADATDWWVGTSQGELARRSNVGPTAAVWNLVVLPAAAAGNLITRIAVHPGDERYVAVATASPNAPFQGRVFLTLDRGTNWADITGQVAVGVPVGGAALQSLPPSPITSLVFDPQPAAAADQTLFAGTLAGVYVIRNLPRRRVPPANAAVNAFNPSWMTFNARGGNGPLPLTLVNDLKLQRLPRLAGAAAGTPEAVDRQRLIAALYGRGMYVTDISNYPAGGPAAGGPPQRLYIRQTVVEDGLRYPRPTPATLNAAPGAGDQPRLGGDPRLPTVPAPFPQLFDDHHGVDIRIDTAPYQFFEDVMDGVEFDEDLRTQPVQPGMRNVIYVQVHSSGWQAVPQATVHLFFAEAPAPGANAADPPLPNLHADFWANFNADPLPAPAAAVVAPAAVWQRAGKAVQLTRIGPNQPAVARFEWVPPAALATTDAQARFVALLAVCTTDADLLPAAPPVLMSALVRNERRAAFRVAAAARFVPDLFIRDGLDDDGRLGGVAYGGRSPDIIVVAAAPADAVAAFTDLGDDRAADRVRGGGGNNVIYVRVHNRKDVATTADVELFWAVPNLPVSAAANQASPPFDQAKWQAIAPVDAINVTVPARGTKLARFDFSAAPAPEAGIQNALAFIALIKSRDAGDPAPVQANVDTPAEFWQLFLTLASSNNAALRALRYA